ncbi:DNA-processing protein DprA [Aliikangiella maris]|uniref:DNA-processing protein DprA n=2 Tax=Aliikangiella maris TaxID=3162458 RepID=A0ABV3MNS8_9GAMM
MKSQDLFSPHPQLTSSDHLKNEHLKTDSLETDELKYTLALKLIRGIGNITAVRLIEYFGSAQQVFKASTEQLAECGLSGKQIQNRYNVDESKLEQLMDWANVANRQIIPITSTLYPRPLKNIHSPPILLFTIGNAELLQSLQLAVVGSRNPTSQGLCITENLCGELVNQGVTITSGMALGIDGQAHRTALINGGYTVAVTGTGLNRIYPAQHRELAYQIAHHGLLVSEKFPDETFNKGSFQQRNRIIAGLSCGTLVVEAAAKSGSLITARIALEEGRDVFAVPGSIYNPLAKGCHALLKQGAKLTETAEDILEEIMAHRPLAQTRLQPALSVLTEKKQSGVQLDEKYRTTEIDTSIDEQTSAFLRCIDYDITPLDTIIQRSELTVEAATNKLLMLELEGRVINTAGGYIRR